ncbi:MAG: hypothetical protein DRJ43_00775 [Thermoprotei archaeon]|nr:MAG: hypothetical protein DRJ43_00775 [Thermoprotei archaeon]
MAEIPVRVPAGEKVRVVAAIVIPLLIVIVVISALSVYQVGLGEVAIVIDPIFQRLGRPVVGPAIAFKPPWAYVVKDYIGVEAIDMFFEPPRDYPAIRALTQDGVLVEVDVTIRYRVIPENFDKLVKAYPRLNYEEDFLVATARQVVREVISNYTLTDIIERREVVAGHVESALAKRLRSDPIIGECLDFLGVNLRNIKLPDEVLSAINEKIAAQQRAIKAEYERKATLIQANASAQKVLIEAKAQAEALLLISRAQAESIQLIANVTGVPSLRIVEYYFYLEAVKEMAKAGRAVMVISPTGAAPLITVPGEGG